MRHSIYVINPKTTVFRTNVFERYGFRPGRYQADLSITTVAAEVPDSYDVELCDEDVDPVDLDHPADIVGITCRYNQFDRVKQLASHFKRRGKVVMIGGPDAAHAAVPLREHVDIVVTGELEGISEQLFDDLSAGVWKPLYDGGRADMATARCPRWDLYRSDRVLLGGVQTARGCPFECEFCDVPTLWGRVQRFKTASQVTHEFDVLYDQGYRAVAIVDDNFLVNRKRTRELLEVLREWNARRSGNAVALAAMFSLDVARDETILRGASDAGLLYSFIGIESVNSVSLMETKKRQNLLKMRPAVGRHLGSEIIVEVSRLLKYGIVPTAGMIVGFDADDESSFKSQLEFAMASPIPIFGVSELTAAPDAPLYTRLKSEGRLKEGDASGKFIPRQMTNDQLTEGCRWLFRQIYKPANFATRVCAAIDLFTPNENAPVFSPYAARRPIEQEATGPIVEQLAESGPEEAAAMEAIDRVLAAKPEATTAIKMILFEYARIHAALYGPSHAGRRAQPAVSVVC
jgi:radical SAM superfamily enzyme YgiQ (UPF0313 family)